MQWGFNEIVQAKMLCKARPAPRLAVTATPTGRRVQHSSSWEPADAWAWRGAGFQVAAGEDMARVVSKGRPGPLLCTSRNWYSIPETMGATESAV